MKSLLELSKIPTAGSRKRPSPVVVLPSVRASTLPTSLLGLSDYHSNYPEKDDVRSGATQVLEPAILFTAALDDFGFRDKASTLSMVER